MQNSSTRMMVEAGLMVAVFAVLSLIATYVPFLSFLSLFFSIPFILMYVRHNAAIMLMTLVASCLVGFMVTQNLMVAVMLLLMSGPVALSIGFLTKGKQKASMILLVTTVVAALGFALFFQVMLTVLPFPGEPKTIVELFQSIFEQSAEMMATMNLPNQEELVETQKSMIALLAVAMPALLLMTGFIYALVNLTFAHQLFNRLRVQYEKPEPFADFFMPNEMMLGITGVFTLLFLAGLLKLLDVQLIIINVISLFVFIFMIQGVATAYGWLLKRGYKKSFVITGIVIVLLLGGLSYGLALLGWLDLLFDFRKIRKPKQ